MIFILLGMLDHEDEGILVLRSAGNNLPKGTALSLRTRDCICLSIERQMNLICNLLSGKWQQLVATIMLSDPVPVHVGFEVDKVALGQVFP